LRKGEIVSALKNRLRPYLPAPVLNVFRKTINWLNPSAPAAETEAVSWSRLRKIIRDIEEFSLEEHLFKRFPKASLTPSVPSLISEIEINDTCNLDCAMCKTSLSKRRKGLMDVALFDRIVEMAKTRGMRLHSLHTIGDPLANPRLRDYLDVLKRHDLPINMLSSNGLLIDRHLDTLFEHRPWIGEIRASIDGASKEVYEKIRIGGKWERLHAAWHAFAKRNEQSSNPFPVFVNSIVSIDNAHEIAHIPRVFNYLAPAEHFTFNFVNSLAPDNEYFFKKSLFGEEFILNAPCAYLWNSIYILRNGDLTTCCRDYHGDLAFGNIDRDDIDLYTHSDFLQAARQAHLDREVSSMPEICRNCYFVDWRYSQLINHVYRHFHRYADLPEASVQTALLEVIDRMKQKRFQDIPETVERFSRKYVTQK